MTSIDIIDGDVVEGYWGFGEITLADNGADSSNPFTGVGAVSNFQDYAWPTQPTPHPGVFQGGKYVWDDGGRTPGIAANAAFVCRKASGAPDLCLAEDTDPAFGIEYRHMPGAVGQLEAGIGEVNAISNAFLVSFPGPSPFWNMTDFTLGVWAYNLGAVFVGAGRFGPTDPGQEKGQTLIGCTSNPTGNSINGFGMGLGLASHLVFSSSGEGGSNAFSLDMGALGGAGQWQHYVVTVSGTHVCTYSGGLPVAEANTYLVNGQGSELSFMNGMHQADSTIWNGGIDNVVLLNRALTAKEVKLWSLIGCKPVARIKKKVTVVPTQGFNPVGARPSTTRAGGDPALAQGVNTNINIDTAITLPPATSWPSWPLDDTRGCYVFSNPNMEEGDFTWPSDTWTQMFFPYTTNDFTVTATEHHFHIRGWDHPDLTAYRKFETPAWYGPALDSSGTAPAPTDPQYPFYRASGVVSSFPHWIVPSSDLVPAPSAPGFIGYYDTGLIDPDRWLSDYAHVYQAGEFVVTHGVVPINPDIPDFYINDLWRAFWNIRFPLAGHTSEPNDIIDHAPGFRRWDMAGRFAKTTFKMRIRETTTDTVISHATSDGKGLQYLGVLSSGADLSSLLSMIGEAHFPEGRRYVCELWHNYPTDLDLPVWGEAYMVDQIHFPGDTTSNAYWPTLP